RLDRQGQNLRPGDFEIRLLTEGLGPGTRRATFSQFQEVYLPHDAGRHAMDLARSNAIDLRHFPNRRAKPQAVLVGDHRGPLRLVLLEDPVQDAVAFVPREIDVDVRRIMASGVQKALEEQMMLQRVHMSDPETIGDDRGRHRSSAAGPRGLSDNFLYHEEIMGKALLPNDGELLSDAVLHSL